MAKSKALDRDQVLRERLLYLMQGKGAHVDFDGAVSGLPATLRGKKPKGLPYTPWALLEHMRLAQWDILDFCRNPNYKAPHWPDDYWPKSDAPPSAAAWDKSVRQFRADLKAMQQLVSDPQTDLFSPIPHGDGQNILREALLVADHNAYHLGQFVTVRRLLGAWKED
jgi:hypothetical protein